MQQVGKFIYYVLFINVYCYWMLRSQNYNNFPNYKVKVLNFTCWIWLLKKYMSLCLFCQSLENTPPPLGLPNQQGYIIISYWWYMTNPRLNDRVVNSLCLMNCVLATRKQSIKHRIHKIYPCLFFVYTCPNIMTARLTTQVHFEDSMRVSSSFVKWFLLIKIFKITLQMSGINFTK